MRPAKFDYQAPSSLTEAAALLTEADGLGRIMAGGQSLMPAMNLRLARPSRVVDLRHVPGLSGIAVERDAVRIGAMTTHAQLIDSHPLRSAIPLVALAGRHIAHSTIRFHGTLGGSLALADPASEWPSVMTLLGGRVRAVSVRGERWIDLRSFFVSFYTTALEPDEILVEIEVPLPKSGTVFAFQEFARQKGAFAIALAAVAFRPSDASMQAVVGGCGRRPVLLELGPVTNPAALQDRIAQAIRRGVLAPTSDIHASADDRREIASSLLKACIAGLLETSSQGGHA